MRFSLGGMLKAFTKQRLKSLAITVAELTVSTAVVGGVALLTLGGVNNAIQTKAMQTEDTLLNNDIAIALANMQANGDLEGNKTQDEFLEKFKKYYDVKEVLTTPEQLKANFADQYEVGGNTVYPDDFQIRFVNSKGESIALTYDTDYKASGQFVTDSSTVNDVNGTSLQARNSALQAITGIYDVNGGKGPNKSGKDVGLFTTIKSNCNNVNLISLSNGECKNDFDPPTEVCDCAKQPDMPQCQQPVVTEYCDTHPTDRNCICMKNPASSYCVDDTSCKDIDCSLSENLTHPCCYDPPVEPCCTLTDDICAADNRTLNKNKCECECTKAKKQGDLELDEKTCTYICKKDFSKFNWNYADKEKSQEACACVPKDSDARIKCKNNGGNWNEDTCSCDCTTSAINKCKEDSCGYAAVNEKANYCACECVESLFNTNIEQAAKSEDKLSGNSLKRAKQLTKFDKSAANKCFVCDSTSTTIGGQTFNVQKGKCACLAGCANKPANPDQYPYFKFNDIDDDAPDGTYCSWGCDTKKLQALVDKLNAVKADDDLRPFAMNKYAKKSDLAARTNGKGTTYVYDAHENDIETVNDFTKFKEVNKRNLGTENIQQTQTWMNIAAILGKLRSQNIEEDQYMVKASGCTTESCLNVYKAVFDSQSAAEFAKTANDTYGRFFRFLIYFNDVETDDMYGRGDGIMPYFATYLRPRADYGTKDQLKELFKLKYIANTTQCAVELREFNYGKEPVNHIWLHGAGEKNKQNLAVHDFYFEYATNKDNFKVKNPNTQTVSGLPADLPTPITRPAEFKAYKEAGHTDADWAKKRVGVIILHGVRYDPLALNMSLSSPLANPSFNMSKAKVNVNLHYGDDKKYHPVSVYWPNDNYQFLVHKDYAKNNTVAYMFSDVYTTKFKKQFRTGFDQLKELDINKDGLITGAELADLRLISKPNVGESDLISLTDKVFEINTNYGIQMDRTGSALQSQAAVYENYGQFRRLVKVDDVAGFCSAKTCLVYSKNKSGNGASVEEWYAYDNSENKYELEPTGGKANAAYKFAWYKLNGSSRTPDAGLSDAILLHNIGGAYYREIKAKVTDIIFKSVH